MTTTNPLSLRRSHRPHRFRYLLALLATISLSACGGGDENGDQDANSSEGTPIRISFGDTVLTARLHDNATARDLAAQLPLSLTFSDFNNVEKIAPLPRKLSLEGAPEGDDPAVGDIGYWSPDGNLVFYYGDVGYWNGIVRIGVFDGEMDVIERQSDDFSVTIERAE